MIIHDMKAFQGVHCETTATGTLLQHIGIELSEPMLFGIGEGLGFIYWHMKSMEFPFLGGRIKQDQLTQNIAKNLGLTVEYKETASKVAAWNNVKASIDNNIPVGLKLDFYHLDYIPEKIHFAGHYVAMYGYDENYAYLVDAAQEGLYAKTTLDSLSLARSEKGPMSSKNLSYTITKADHNFNFKETLRNVIRNNAIDFLNPPIKNIGYKGIQKLSGDIKKWFTLSNNIEHDLTLTASLMEGGGTGGALFRNLYRDFLYEADALLKIELIKDAHLIYQEVAMLWTETAKLIEQAGHTKDESFLASAADILVLISTKEKAAMELLAKL